jgi:hypothetical protein
MESKRFLDNFSFEFDTFVIYSGTSAGKADTPSSAMP